MNIIDLSDSTKVSHEMMFYEDRLQSFEHWSKQIEPNKMSLAKAGFYYTGSADKVTCFSCGVKVMSWEPSDQPWEEHEKWSPACIYLKMTGYKNGDTGSFAPGFIPASKNAPVTFGHNNGFGTQAPSRGHGAFALDGQQTNKTSSFGPNSVTGANLFVGR